MGATREIICFDGTFKMEASNGIPWMYEELATAQIDGVGEVRVGIHAANLAVYVMMPGRHYGRDDAPPHLFTIKMTDLIQPVLQAAVARFAAADPLKGGGPE